MRSSSSPSPRRRRAGALRRLAAPAGLAALALALGLVLTTPGAGASGTSGSVGTGSSASTLALGKMLFDQTCSSCHGSDAQGSAFAPNLHGLGAATVDLWVSSGWMPLANPTSQPIRKPSLFDRAKTEAIAAYVQSVGGGPDIPKVDLAGTSVSEGFSIFALNCAPCHTVTGAGDALSNGLLAPPLHGVTATQVAEAVRTGPENMPRFATGTISKKQLADLVAYVTTGIEHPNNAGGLGLGGVGPVAEGFVGLFVGVGACVLIAFWIGDRTERDGGEHEHGDDAAGPAGDGGTGDGAEVVHA